MLQPRENLQRARQLDQDVQPTGSADSARNTTSPPRKDRIAKHRVLRAKVDTLLIWVGWGLCGVFCVWSWLYFINRWAKRGGCTSDWILDTTAPYHTTNQLCAFSESYHPIKNFDSPVTYKGVETHSYGLVKLDLQYYIPTVVQNITIQQDHHPSYANLDLHFAQYVPEQANTISVSQLMKHNNGSILLRNMARVDVSENGMLGLRIGDKTFGTTVPAKEINGHYVFKARVPPWLGHCECPDPKERSLFKVS